MLKPIQVHFDGLIYQKQAHGGISRNFSNLIDALSRGSAADVHLYLEDSVAAPVFDAVTVHRLPGEAPLARLPMLGRLSRGLSARSRRAAWRAPASGVFHSTYYSSPAGVRIPQVLTMHDTIVEDYPAFFNAQRDRIHLEHKRDAFARCHALVFPSEFARDRTEAVYGISGRQVSVIPHALDSRFRVRPAADRIEGFRNDASEGRPYLLHVGSRYAHKNVDRLLEAFAAWEGRGDFRLLLAGGGALAPSESELVDRLGIADSVRVRKSLDDDALLLAYHGATAFVFPSLSEGFGFPVLEALACACPVACSSSASLPEVGGDAPVYFDPLSTDSLVAALREVVAASTDRPRWQAASAKALSRSWEDAAGEYLEIYDRAASTGANTWPA